MEEFEIENDNSPNEPVKEDTITPEPVEVEQEQDKSIKTAIAQKEHFKEKALKLETQLKELQAKMPTTAPTPQDPLELVKLAKALEGYDEEETQFIVRNAKSKDVKAIVEASKDDWVKTAIEAKREKDKKDNKIPSPDNPSGSEFKPKSMAEINSMSQEEFDRYQRGLFEQAQRSKLGQMGL